MKQRADALANDRPLQRLVLHLAFIFPAQIFRAQEVDDVQVHRGEGWMDDGKRRSGKNKIDINWCRMR
jgi:hypothetical protein